MVAVTKGGIMHRIILIVFVLTFGIASLGCGPKLSAEQYGNLMSEMGCNGITEGSPQAKELYEKYGATQEDVMEFRQKARAKSMMEVAGIIAQRVAECHGITLKQ